MDNEVAYRYVDPTVKKLAGSSELDCIALKTLLEDQQVRHHLFDGSAGSVELRNKFKQILELMDKEPVKRLVDSGQYNFSEIKPVVERMANQEKFEERYGATNRGTEVLSTEKSGRRP